MGTGGLTATEGAAIALAREHLTVEMHKNEARMFGPTGVARWVTSGQQGAMSSQGANSRGPFRHEAVFYAGSDGFVKCVLPFVRGAIGAGEPVLVAVPPWNAEPFREALAGDAGAVTFADMETVGRNPGRIIPAWRDFVDGYAPGSGRARGVGEPIWAGRNPEEVEECVRHEALLNEAFRGQDFWLLCPYDVSSLPAAVIEGARRCHPFERVDEQPVPSATYARSDVGQALAGHLGVPSADNSKLDFGIADLVALRRLVQVTGRKAGLPEARIADLVVAANEVATNSVVHGGGKGTLTLWTAGDEVLCEIRDPGVITDPLAGRERPKSSQESGRGLWLANQLCDLVQTRSGPGGTVVRMHLQIA